MATVSPDKKDKSWKQGNPYLDSILPEGRLMTLEQDPNVPFIGQDSELKPARAKVNLRPNPCEMIKGTALEHQFHPVTYEPPFAPK